MSIYLLKVQCQEIFEPFFQESSISFGRDSEVLGPVLLQAHYLEDHPRYRK